MSRPLPACVLPAAFFLASACGPAAHSRLVIAYPVGLHSPDVHDPAHEEFAASILANVYETLVDVGPDLTLQPSLAESWYSPDEQTWVFTLRSGVRLHDGRTLEAADVAASVERARQTPWMRGELEPVVSVTARGEGEVVFKTQARFESLPARLTYVSIDGGSPGPGSLAAGTGAYRIRSSSPEATLLEAFPEYREGPAPIPSVEFRTIADARERARRLRNGEIHLIIDVLPEDMPSLATHPGLRTIARPGLRVVFLGMDCARERSAYLRPPRNAFQDRRVREAISLAIDRDALAKGPLQGYAEATQQIPGPTEVGFEPALQPRRFDPERARLLLQQAGYRDGFETPLDYMPGKYLAVEAVVESLVLQLGRIGIQVRPQPRPPADMLQHVESQDTAFYLLGWMNETGSAHETYASLLHSVRPNLGATNGGGYANPRFDLLLERVSGELDRGKRVELLREATRIVDADLPVVPLYRQHDLYAHVRDLEFNPSVFRRLLLERLRWRRS